MKKIYYLMIIFLSAGLQIMYSQGNWQLSPSATGEWTYVYDNNQPYGTNPEKMYKLSAADLTISKQHLTEIANILKTGMDYKGYSVDATGRFAGDETNPPIVPLSRVQLKFYSLWADKSGKVKKYWGEAPEVNCYINDVGPSGAAYTLNYKETGYDRDVAYNNAVRKLNRLFIRPDKVKEIASGVTAYADGSIVIAKAGKPYWKSVTFGELFDLFENYYALEDKKNNMDCNSQYSLLGFLKKDKEAFPAEWLSLPCMKAEDLMQKFSLDFSELPKLSGVVPLYARYMRENPSYFDKTLPPSAIQAITLYGNTDIFGDKRECTDEDAAQTAVCVFLKNVDYSALQRLLK